MKIKGSIAKGVILALALTFIPFSAFSAQKVTPGQTCKVLNQKVSYQNKSYTCVQSGKKLVWNKGKQSSIDANVGSSDDKLLYAGIKNAIPEKGWLTSFPLATKDEPSRSYSIYIPSTYTPENSSPLLIALHGISGWNLQLMYNTGFNDLAEANGFIVAYPNGNAELVDNRIIRSWNGGACCAISQRQNSDDLRYINNLIDDVSSRFSINSKRVYLTGHSNGSMLAQKLACQLSNKITAVAVVAGRLLLDACNPESPVSILQIYGTADTLNPENGGTTNYTLGAYTYQFSSRPVMSSVQMLAVANGCSTNFSENKNVSNKDLTISTWPDCKNGVVVSAIKITGASHAWMGHPAQSEESIKLIGEPYMKLDASKAIWSFLANKVKN
jgi:polyhydroxybutyrate depolymerase